MFLQTKYQSGIKFYVNHQPKLTNKFIVHTNPSTLDLNYKNINNNNVTRSPRSFDYTVKDPLSLAKLFVQPFMSKFTGFDQTMDISAVLSVIGEAAPFIGAAAHAKTVRSDIRNEWAHCNFTNWTEAKFIAAFQSMESLLKNVNLSTEEEQKLCDELNGWKDKGKCRWELFAKSEVIIGGEYSTSSSVASPTIWSCYANLNHYHYSFL